MSVKHAETVVDPINRYLAKRRGEVGKFSMQELADEIGCSRRGLYRVIRGEDEVSTDLIERIEAATGIPAEQLFAWWKSVRRQAAAA